MENRETADAAQVLKQLPSTDAVLQTAAAHKILLEAGAARLTILTRNAVDQVRQKLQKEILNNTPTAFSREDLLNEAESNLENIWQSERQTALQKVINATGVIIHTNLGRAPLSEKAKQAVAEIAGGYCTLEYNLADGKRGKRGLPAETLLAALTGAEAALIVNNCAAAAFLVLTVFAGGGEAIISRGELVEIGGDFRVPDVLEQSGAVLKEIGTTNRTKIADYEKAINEKTKVLLRVHPSNYRIVGFTAMPQLAEIAALARKHALICYEDAGSGALLDLSKYGLADEPVISDSIKAGADVVTFSGDKLLGGVQSGLIVGKKEVIEKLRKHPLYRALRVDKMIYAALAATLEAFRRETALQEVPVLRMLSMSGEKLKSRTEDFANKLRKSLDDKHDLQIEIIEGNSVIGGGSAPMVQPATTLLALRHEKISIPDLEKALRFSEPPVIARILENKLLIDLRTVPESDEPELLRILSSV